MTEDLLLLWFQMALCSFAYLDRQQIKVALALLDWHSKHIQLPVGDTRSGLCSMLMVHAINIYATLDVNMHQGLSPVCHNPSGKENKSAGRFQSEATLVQWVQMHWAITPFTHVRPDCIVCQLSLMHLLDSPGFHTLFAILQARSASDAVQYKLSYGMHCGCS